MSVLASRAAAAVLVAGLLAPIAASPAGAAIRFVAFGDSITEGYGDDSQQGGGYPARLQRWLRQRGYDANVVNQGVGGETTGEALSRVDGVLAQGGDYFLLMEGTNDVSHRVSNETILFNLDQLATRAETAGMTSLHGTCIPRLPTASVDGDNAKTSALAGAVVDLGGIRSRLVADQFALFESLPDLFDNYYYDPEHDPVGHPNGAGYQEMAGLWLETVLALLESPQLTIVPPPQPVPTREVVAFQAQLTGSFTRLEWDFGDGGFASSESPVETIALHVFLAPGTYTVRLTGESAGGGIATDQAVVTVSGTTASWLFRTAAVPIVARGDGSTASDVRLDLALANAGDGYALVDIVLAPEIEYDQPPPMRRLLVAPQSVLHLADALAELFHLPRARGALLLTYRTESPQFPGSLTGTATLSLADDASASDTVPEIASGSWSAADKTISGISGTAATVVDLAIGNLDGAGGYVRLDLYDAGGDPVDSALFELLPGEVRLRRLTDLYRRLELRPQPFTALLRSSGVRFTAAALVTDPFAGEVEVLPATP